MDVAMITKKVPIQVLGVHLGYLLREHLVPILG